MCNCIICNKSNDGIIVYGRKICIECEKKIINTDLNTDFYLFYNKCIRKKLVKGYVKNTL
ncbi:sigma factor G inhibitor Gin [Clostridium senegalense]|uniref:Sigma factor G inhibitor Gin n=1 Tax=Clostridium senegalense TaxID=1465809 RepID=A0A6M0GZJ3_9CLOT|nr:sigma factor G inhibitor Gin [Clostridium senegalense]NEU03960.1 hypothetical protein [Clostridium senegalense]